MKCPITNKYIEYRLVITDKGMGNYCPICKKIHLTDNSLFNKTKRMKSVC